MEVRSRDGVAPLIVALCLGFVTACDKPQVGSASAPLTAGGVEFKVGDYDVQYLEIADGANTYEYPRPVLVIPISLKNVGEGSLVYTPSHNSSQMTEAATPLLYLDPGADAKLPPESKSIIPGVSLAKGQLAGQASTTTLDKGQSVDDLLLFEVPDGARSLILSLPPSMHREKLPVLFRVNFEPMEPKGPKVYKIGDSVDFAGVSFSVTKSEYDYVRIKDGVQGEGFSSEPLLKIEYTITNEGSDTVRYEPGHRDLNARGAALFGAENAFKRVRFPGTTRVVGQNDATTIDAGKSVSDFVLFESPGPGVSSLSFEFTAAQFGREGIARFEIPFEHREVAKPKELKAP